MTYRCGKSFLAEQLAMRAWRGGANVVQYRLVDGELRPLAWLPRRNETSTSEPEKLDKPLIKSWTELDSSC